MTALIALPPAVTWGEGRIAGFEVDFGSRPNFGASRQFIATQGIRDC